MKVKAISALALTAVFLTGCGSASAGSASEPAQDIYATLEVSEPQTYTKATLPDTSSDGIDIDLTAMSSNMVYAQVADMVNNGDDYIGKKVKVSGPFSYVMEDDGREFYAVIISDATACCTQGIEFILAGDHKYPDDYPEIGKNITVTGDFDYYTEDYYVFCQLLNAEMTVGN